MNNILCCACCCPLVYTFRDTLRDTHSIFFFLLSSNSVTLLIKIPLTSALRSCLDVAVRGSVWLVVVLVVVLWVWLGVELKESNAHAMRTHKDQSKKTDPLSHIQKEKHKRQHTKDMLSLYTKKTANYLYSTSFVGFFAWRMGETCSLVYTNTPS